MNDREKLIELIRAGEDKTPCAINPYDCREIKCRDCEIESIADHLIANGLTVQKHGRWELHNSGKGTCSECRMTTVAVWDDDNSLKYCPSCGAKMDMEE